MHERRKVEHPMWRKKADGTLIREGWTPIPKWLWEVWSIEESFGNVSSKQSPEGEVKIICEGASYKGHVAKVRAQGGFRYRLYIDSADLVEQLAQTFLMTYMRVIESEISPDLNHRQVEKEISFWEFLDIEFDNALRTFNFVAYYTVKPQFPHLFAKLVRSAPLKAISSEVLEGSISKIHKQDWRPREEYRTEIGAENVIYMLIDTMNKLLYIGEANNLVNRFNGGHPDIKDWTDYKYSVLPAVLSPYRLTIERMLIRDMASLMTNKQGIQKISISDYKLANRRIDK
jgi:hypothetical protein